MLVSWQCLKKYSIQITHGPAIALLDIYQREMKIYVTQKPVYECLTKTFFNGWMVKETGLPIPQNTT